MGSRARIGGQPINQFLAVVPIGLCATAVLFDLASLVSGWRFFGEVGYWNLAAGLITATIAVTVGVVDLLGVLSNRTGRRTAAQYVALTAAMLGLVGLAWFDRMRGGHAGGALTFAVELLALTAGAAGLWLARGLVVHGDVTSAT